MYKPIDFGTEYYPSGEDMKDVKAPSSTYDNSNLTVGEIRQRQLENAGLARDKDGKAISQRTANSNTSKARMGSPKMSSFLNKAAGIEQFNPYVNNQSQSVKPQPAAKEITPWEEAENMNKVSLKYRGLTGTQDIDYNIDKLNRYDKAANNEKNRALGMELATKLPYSSFEENLRSMRQAGINAANLTQSISGAYNSSVSKLNPVSMSL